MLATQTAPRLTATLVAYGYGVRGPACPAPVRVFTARSPASLTAQTVWPLAARSTGTPPARAAVAATANAMSPVAAARRRRTLSIRRLAPFGSSVPCSLRSEHEHDLVHVAPAPVFAGLDRTCDRMSGFTCVAARVAIRRRIA